MSLLCFIPLWQHEDLEDENYWKLVEVPDTTAAFDRTAASNWNDLKGVAVSIAFYLSTYVIENCSTVIVVRNQM